MAAPSNTFVVRGDTPGYRSVAAAFTNIEAAEKFVAYVAKATNTTENDWFLTEQVQYRDPTKALMDYLDLELAHDAADARQAAREAAREAAADGGS